MSDENVNKISKNQPEMLKIQTKLKQLSKKWKKIIKSNKCSMLWLAYQQGKISKRFKAINKFINMINHFGISKSTIVFKTSFVKFSNNYPKMRKSSHSLHFLKNNFKIN